MATIGNIYCEVRKLYGMWEKWNGVIICICMESKTRGNVPEVFCLTGTFPRKALRNSEHLRPTTRVVYSVTQRNRTLTCTIVLARRMEYARLLTTFPVLRRAEALRTKELAEAWRSWRVTCRCHFASNQARPKRRVHRCAKHRCHRLLDLHRHTKDDPSLLSLAIYVSLGHLAWSRGLSTSQSAHYFMYISLDHRPLGY
jgi:hypothetical protein